MANIISTEIQVKGKKPKERTITWTPTTAEKITLIKLEVSGLGNGGDVYLCRQIGCDFGLGFQLTKINFDDCQVYHVNIDEPVTSCECKGFLRWGHCKHIDTLQTLILRGHLGGQHDDTL